jgi:hypothetical protein
VCLGVSAAMAMMLLSTYTSAQNGGAPATSSTVPRALDGHPDLSGVYQAGSTRVGNWAETNDGFGVGGTGKADPGGAQRGPARAPRLPPYQPWVLEMLNKNFQRRNIDQAAARCIPSITFTTTGLFPVEFVQSPKKVVILIEYMGVFRNIPLNVKHPEDHEPTYMGTSVGRWEGDTLVVDTIDFMEQLDNGRPHSDQLHLVERFTRTDLNTIKYHADWDDPKVMTRPDTIDTQFMLRPDTRVREYICNENNQEPDNFEKLKKGDAFIRK